MIGDQPDQGQPLQRLSHGSTAHLQALREILLYELVERGELATGQESFAQPIECLLGQEGPAIGGFPHRGRGIGLFLHDHHGIRNA